MPLAVKRSFTWLWMAALLTATVGFSVHRIYCYCLDRATVSLFAPAEEGCGSAAAENCCEKPAVPACCAGDEQHDADHRCTDESTEVFQLKTEFVVDKPFEKSFDCPLWLHELPFFSRKLKPALCTAPVVPDAPPPDSPSGWEICLRHQLFLC